MLKELPKINPNQKIAVDLETCDPELRFTAPGFISNVGFVAGVAIKAEEGAWYIPIHHAKGENYDEKTVVEWLNYTLSGDTAKIFHNAQYDLGWLYHMGVRVRGRIRDTMLAAPLLNENRFAYTLDSLGKIYCGEGKYEEALAMAVAAEFNETRTHKTIIRLNESGDWSCYPFVNAKVRQTQLYDIWPAEVQKRYTVIGTETSARNQTLFKLPIKREADIKGLLWAVDPAEMGSYPVQDVELTYKLDEVFTPLLEEEDLTELMEMECELIMPLLEMRMKGVRIDMARAVELDAKYTKILNELQTKLNGLAGFEVNVNMTTDLVAICEKFGLKYSKTEKGNPCFSSEMVPQDDMGIFETVLAIREMLKARDTYIRGYIFGCTIDGWLHGQYNQLKSDEGGTVTGRLSSSQPNMQNLPNPKEQIGKDIRGLFLPDNDDEKWLSMDYSGQEPKMMVHTVLLLNKKLGELSKIDPEFRDRREFFPGAHVARLPQFRSREADFHTATATICMENEYRLEGKEPAGEEFKKACKAFRPKAKSIGLGVMYGSGNAKVAEEMTKKGFPMTPKEAGAIRDSIYTGVPFLKALSDHLSNEAKRKGYIKTILGRRGRFDTWECPIWEPQLKLALRGANTNFKTRLDAFKWYNEYTRTHRDDAQNIAKPARGFTYKALNKYIQGSSADQTKTAMLHLYKRNDLTLNALDIFYRAIPGFEPPKFKTQVHDEVNISMVKGESPEWYQDIMENCIPLEVEVVAEPVVCDRWSEAK